MPDPRAEVLVGSENGQRRERGPEPGALSALIEEIARGSAAGEAPSHPALRPGASLGRFELVREIGRGGFGVVWEARDRELGRRVAVKVVRPAGSAIPTDDRLLHEAEAAARLSHPNIVTLHDVGRSEAGPFLVLEMLDGRALSSRLRDGALPPGEAVRIAVEVAKGLAHAHAHGVIHRDLKPDNVFLCDDGSVKILDFGLSRAFGVPRLDGGTPSYMAPEQLAGAPEDERTDVFALGLVAFEMLAGRRPFPDARALRSSASAPALQVPGHPAVGEIVARMLAKDPLHRPRDGREVLSSLARLGGELQVAPPLGRVRTRRRVPALLWGAALAVALASGFLVALGLRTHAPAGPPSVAVLPFADISPQKDQEYLADGIAEEILSALARVDGLRVPGRLSSFYFKGRPDDLRAIGERLAVAHVLEGTIRRSGDRIRVTAELVSVADGYRIWSDSYERPLGDVFAVQDDIARAVVAGLRVTLAANARPVAPGARSSSAESYAEFLRGRHLFRRTTARDYQLAIAALERAVALDPGYAPAWAALASVHFNLPALQGTATDLEEGVAKARAFAERAIALAPRLPDGYASRAELRTVVDHDWAGARSDLERALALSPRDTAARTNQGNLLAALGRLDDAVAITEGVLRDDPLATEAAWYLGSYYNALGRYPLARAVLGRALEIAPEQARVLRELAFTEILDGRPLAALDVIGRCPVEWMRDLVATLAYHDAGREGDGDVALGRVRREAGTLAYQLAQVHAWRGEPGEAFEWLERARVQRDPGLHYAKYDPLLRRIRGDPRYLAVLRRMNLPLD